MLMTDKFLVVVFSLSECDIADNNSGNDYYVFIGIINFTCNQ